MRNQPRSLTKEKSLREINSVFEDSFSHPIKAKIICAIVFSISLPITIILSLTPSTPTKLTDNATLISIDEVASLTKNLATSGLALGIGVLAIIIAGFSIFAAGIDKDLLKSLTRKTKPLYYGLPTKGGERPYLVFIYSIFTYTMTTFTVLSAFSIALIAIADVDSAIFSMLSKLGENLSTLTMSLCLSSIMALISFSISILFSFIWNLYVVLIGMAGLRMEKINKEENTQ